MGKCNMIFEMEARLNLTSAEMEDAILDFLAGKLTSPFGYTVKSIDSPYAFPIIMVSKQVEKSIMKISKADPELSPQALRRISNVLFNGIDTVYRGNRPSRLTQKIILDLLEQEKIKIGITSESKYRKLWAIVANDAPGLMPTTTVLPPSAIWDDKIVRIIGAIDKYGYPPCPEGLAEKLQAGLELKKKVPYPEIIWHINRLLILKKIRFDMGWVWTGRYGFSIYVNPPKRQKRKKRR